MENGVANIAIMSLQEGAGLSTNGNYGFTQFYIFNVVYA